MDSNSKDCPQCAEVVRAEAKICRHCGYDFAGAPAAGAPAPAKGKGSLFKKGLGCFGLLVLLVIVVGIFAPPPKDSRSAGNGTTASPSRDGPGVTAQSTAAQPESRGFSPYKVTLKEYSEIRDGMSYAQVVKIIGEEGIEQSSSNMAGIRTVAYSWQNFDGSNIMLMFQNDRLITKAQAGL